MLVNPIISAALIRVTEQKENNAGIYEGQITYPGQIVNILRPDN